MKRDTRFKPGISGNETTQWKAGQSGNPAGISKVRANFERAFVDALVSDGSAEEAAHLLWLAARRGEPWAIQSLCQRFAPETHSLRLIQETNNDTIDYSKLTNEQLDQLEAIIESASTQPAQTTGGESTS